MKFLDYIRTAWKNLSRQKVRTVLTVIAITVGSLSLILMASLIIGVRQSVMDSLQQMGAFNLVTVTRDPNAVNDNPQLITSSNNDPAGEEGRKIDDATLTSVRKLPDVVDATPVLSVWVKTIHLEGQNKKMWSNIISYQPSTHVFDLPLLAGRNVNDTDMDKIVVGSRFMQTYGYTSPEELIGKKVILSYQGGGGNAPDWGPLPEKPPPSAGKEWWDAQSQEKELDIQAEIVGVADNRAMDDNQNYVSISWAKRLMTNVHWQFDETAQNECQRRNQEEQDRVRQMNGSYAGGGVNCDSQMVMRIFKEDNFTKSGYGSIIAKVSEPGKTKAVAEMIGKMGYGVTTAENMIAQMNKIFTILSVVLSLIGGISLFVAAIGIINTMVMATYERTKEIGVMRACGATRASIRKLFTLEAALLGFLGGVLGVLLSLILGQIARLLVQKFGANLGNLPLDSVGNFPWWLVIVVVCFTTSVGLLSGLYPAIRASRLKPVDALRYE